jgi:hypothetical protein
VCFCDGSSEIFCTQGGGTGENQRGFHNEELHNLHSSLDIITMADWKRLRSQDILHVQVRNKIHKKFFQKKLKERDNFEDVGLDGRILRK